MNRKMIFALLALSPLAACQKQEAPPPPPVQQQAAPVPVQTVQPGMEAQNPAEKEGRP